MGPFRLFTRTRGARKDRVRNDRARKRRVLRDGDARAPGTGGESGLKLVPPPLPVPVPWRVVRRTPSAIELEWRGDGVAEHVRFALSGDGLLGLSMPHHLRPGERIRVAVSGVHARDAAGARDAMLVLRWFQPDGIELLWPIPVE